MANSKKTFKNGEDGSNDDQALLDWMYGRREEDVNDEDIIDDYANEYAGEVWRL